MVHTALWNKLATRGNGLLCRWELNGVRGNVRKLCGFGPELARCVSESVVCLGILTGCATVVQVSSQLLMFGMAYSSRSMSSLYGCCSGCESKCQKASVFFLWLFVLELVHNAIERLGHRGLVAVHVV